MLRLKIEKKDNRILLTTYILVFACVFVSESLLLNYGGPKADSIRRVLRSILWIVPIIYQIFSNNMRLKLTPSFFILAVIMLVNGIVSFYWGYTFLDIVMCVGTLLFSYTFVLTLEFETFKRAYVHIMLLMSIVSLFLFVVVQFFPGLAASFLPTIVLEKPSTGQMLQYYTLFFGNTLPDTVLARSDGTFWEPGIFQAYLLVGMVFVMFKDKPIERNDILTLCIFIAALITTFSTTGFIGLLALLACYVLKSMRYDGKSKRKGFLFIVLIIGAMGILLADELVFDRVFNKIVLRKDSNSVQSRLGSLWGNIQAFLQSPIWGNGLNSTNVMQGITSNDSLHQTNTFSNYFSSYGLLGGLFFVYGWIKTIRLIERNSRIVRFLLFIFIVIITSGENFLYSMFFNTLVFYGYNNGVLQKTGSDID